MNVLVIGSGGREHAICYKLAQSKKLTKLYALPGNPGIASVATCVKGSVEDNIGIVSFCKENNIDFVVVGPEVPLVNGLVDDLNKEGILAFGPNKYAAQFEGSKAFTKDFLIRHNIPTAQYVEVKNFDDAVNALEKFSYPVVVKADGLAAGKGVVIAQDRKEAIDALKEIMVNKVFAEAGNTVVIEEFLTGFECSLLCFVDGNTLIPMVSAKDHKQIYDGNLGPNTGGMGNVSPNPFLENMDEVLKETILDPFLKGIKEDNIDFRGCLFVGLMIENGKAKVLEYNVRFGDPETQVIMLRLDSDLLEIMEACAKGTLNKVDVKWKDEIAFCLVLASGGYPGHYQKGFEIKGLDSVKDCVVFHAGTSLKDGKIVTSGGRVLNVCTTGKTIEECREKVYAAAEKIDFEGKYYRHDIGLVK